MSTRKGDYRPPTAPRYSAQAFDLKCYGVWDSWSAKWVTGHYFEGRQRRDNATRAASELNEKNGSRS